MSNWLLPMISVFIFLSFFAFAQDAEMTRSLIDQLNGKRCDYRFVGTCEKRDIGFLEHVGISSIGNMNEQCILWSAQCLGLIKPPEAVLALTEALKIQSNVQTCDGIIPLRDMIIKTLAEIGDKRAIPALEEYIKVDSYERLSAGASGCTAKPESKQLAKESLAHILAD